MGHPRNEKKKVTILYTGGRFRTGDNRNNLEFGKELSGVLRRVGCVVPTGSTGTFRPSSLIVTFAAHLTAINALLQAGVKW